MSRSTTTTTTKTTDYSIPGKFVVIIQSSNAPRQPPPPVIGHCLLCLRRLREPTGIQNLKMGETLDDLTIVPKGVLSEDHLLPTFNKLLPFIHRKWKPKKKTDPLDLLNKNIPEYQQDPDSGASSLPKNFPHLPAMCTLCGQQLQQLDGLIKQLGGKIEEIKRTIKMSKMPEGAFGWRQLQFEDDMRNNEDLNEMSRKRTMEFLEGFGEVDEDVEEGEEEEVVVEATDGGGEGEEVDPLAFDDGEGEEDEDFVVKVEVEESQENFEEEDEDEDQNNEEDWSPEIKREPESGPSYQSRKRTRRQAPGPASKTGRKSQPSEIINDSFEERREEGGPRRSSRITIDKSRTLSLSSSSSAVKGPGPSKFSYR